MSCSTTTGKNISHNLIRHLNNLRLFRWLIKNASMYSVTSRTIFSTILQHVFLVSRCRINRSPVTVLWFPRPPVPHTRDLRACTPSFRRWRPTGGRRPRPACISPVSPATRSTSGARLGDLYTASGTQVSPLPAYRKCHFRWIVILWFNYVYPQILSRLLKGCAIRGINVE